MKKGLKLWKMVFLLTVFGAMTILGGCKIEDRPASETLVLTVDETRIYKNEMMYHLLLAKMEGELYASYLGEGENFWNKEYEEGKTIEEAMKDMAMENAIKYELFYEMALQEGFELTEEEKEIGIGKAENMMKNIQTENLENLGLTKEKLIQIQDKITLASRYYDEYITTLKVDEEAVKASLNSEDYKQYDIEYIFAKEQGYEELKGQIDRINTTKNFSDLTKDTNLKWGILSFLQDRDTFGEEKILEETIKGMKKGEVSEIIETVKGFYIIKLVDNTSSEKYEEAVKNTLESAKTEAFETAFNSLKKEHKIKIENKTWKAIVLSKIL